MNYEELINNFTQEQLVLTGSQSESRNQHILTALNYLYKLNTEIDWTKMSDTDAKELYSNFLMSDLADTTKALRSRFILQFYRYLVAEKINENMTLNGVLKLKPHAKKPVKLDKSQILTENQLNIIFSYKFKNKTLPIYQKLAIIFTFGGGARIGEVLNLKLKDIRRGTWENKPYYRVYIDDTKTFKHRTTFITNPTFVRYLDDYITKISPYNPENFVLSNSDTPIKYSEIRYWYDKLRKATGIKALTSHKGRKYNISHRIANGESIASVSMTSHGSPNSPALKHYLYLHEDDVLSNIMKNK